MLSKGAVKAFEFETFLRHTFHRFVSSTVLVCQAIIDE